MNDAETRPNPTVPATEDRLHALILRWHDALAQGGTPTPEEICREAPELVEDFRRATKPDPDESTPDRPTQISDSLRAYANIPRPDIPGYQVLQALGRGGMGTVFLARQLGLNRLVAIKMLLMSGLKSSSDKALARFRAEGEALARLQHPNVVSIHTVGEQDGNPYFVMEYVSGGSLAGRLRGGPFDPASAAAITAALAGAAHATHKLGIIHRDMKPSNVLLQPIDAPPTPRESGSGLFIPAVELDGRWYVPKLTDYGLAKYLDGDQKLTRAGVALGTPEYMSPEQASGQSEQIGPATDVWGLGAVLYELLTGRPPFHGKTDTDTMRQVVFREVEAPRKTLPECPAALESICLKCLAKSPRHRYQTAELLQDDLRAFLVGDPIDARPVVGRRNPWLVPLVAGLTFAAGVLVTLTAAYWLQPKPPAVAPPTDAEIRAIAAAARKKLADDIWGRRLADGWLPRNLATDANPSEQRETWSHAHALAALLMTPEFRRPGDAVRESLLVPFRPGLADDGPGGNTARRTGLLRDAAGSPLGWLPYPEDGVRATSALPAMFTAISLASAVGRGDILDAACRPQLLDDLGTAERVLRRHRPEPFEGRWNLLVDQQPPGDVYSTAVALQMLLLYHKHRLPYDGSEHQRDHLLKQTAQWLIKKLDAQSSPSGWRATDEHADPIIPGLTLQILAQLLQARAEAGVTLPPLVLRAVPENLAAVEAATSVDQLNDSGKLVYTGRTIDTGDPTAKPERTPTLVKYFAYPWAIAVASRWQAEFPDDALARRVLIQYVGTLHAKATDVHDCWLYIPTERLEGLAAVPVP